MCHSNHYRLRREILKSNTNRTLISTNNRMFIDNYRICQKFLWSLNTLYLIMNQSLNFEGENLKSCPTATGLPAGYKLDNWLDQLYLNHNGQGLNHRGNGILQELVQANLSYYALIVVGYWDIEVLHWYCKGYAEGQQ